METVTQSVPEGLETVRVTRNGSVDWHYPPNDMAKAQDAIN